MASDELKVRIVLDDGTIRRGFINVERQAQKTGKRAGKSLGSIGGALKRSLTGVKAQLVGIAGSVVAIRDLTREFGRFNESVAEVTTITNALNSSMEEFEDQLLRVSAQFGKAPAEQARTYYQIISAGITDVTTANQVLIASNKLAIGGLTTAEGAVDALTSVINAYGKENISASRAGDILFGTVRLGKLRVSDLQATIGQVLPSASQLGITFEEVGAALARLTQKGLPAAQAVTQLQSIFTAVLRKQKLAKTFGKDVADAFSLAALRSKPFEVFLKDLFNSLGRSEEKLVKLLGRVEGAKAILSLGADNFQKLGELTGELTNKTGALDEAYQKIDDTLNQQFKVTLNTIRSSFIALGKTQGGAAVGFLKDFNKGLKLMLEVFLDINKEGGIFKQIGLSIDIAFLKIARFIQLMIISFNDFGGKIIQVLLWPFEKILLIIGDMGTALSGLPGLGEVGADLKKFADDAVTSIRGIGLAPNKVAQDNLKELDSQLTTLLQIQAGATTAQMAVSNVFAEAGENIKDGADDVKEGAQDIEVSLKNITDAFDDLSDKFKVTGKKIATVLRRTFITGFTASFSAFGRALATGKNAFAEFGKAVLNTLGGLAIQIGQFFILVGLGMSSTSAILGVSGGAAVAAGIALTILGGFLQGLAGGGGAGAGAGGAGGGGGGAPDTAEPITEEPDDLEELATTQINVNVQGDVFDSDETGTRIAQIVNESFDQQGTLIQVEGVA